MTQSVIATRALTKRYGDVVAVRDLDLEVERGRIFGLLGPNGAGKTTIIGCLLGLIVPDGGRIELFGADGAVEDLIHGQNRIRLGTTDDAAAARVLAALDWVESVSARDGGLSVVADPQRTWELTAALAGDGVYVAEMRIEETSLEQYFLSVVEEQRE
jgi:ABC-type uncharacterized transport system ATPase subunit